MNIGDVVSADGESWVVLQVCHTISTGTWVLAAQEDAKSGATPRLILVTDGVEPLETKMTVNELLMEDIHKDAS